MKSQITANFLLGNAYVLVTHQHEAKNLAIPMLCMSTTEIGAPINAMYMTSTSTFMHLLCRENSEYLLPFCS